MNKWLLSKTHRIYIEWQQRVLNGSMCISKLVKCTLALLGKIVQEKQRLLVPCALVMCKLVLLGKFVQALEQQRMLVPCAFVMRK
jgi:hypothetical protein